MYDVTDRSLDLRASIEASGYYPEVVADAVFAAVAAAAWMAEGRPTEWPTRGVDRGSSRVNP